MQNLQNPYVSGVVYGITGWAAAAAFIRANANGLFASSDQIDVIDSELTNSSKDKVQVQQSVVKKRQALLFVGTTPIVYGIMTVLKRTLYKRNTAREVLLSFAIGDATALAFDAIAMVYRPSLYRTSGDGSVRAMAWLMYGAGIILVNGCLT